MRLSALDVNPDSIRERLNYGLALLEAGDIDRGVGQLQAVQWRAPSLRQVKDTSGHWQTVIDDMGMPRAKPRPLRSKCAS